jgi:prolyl oligopeptidase
MPRPEAAQSTGGPISELTDTESAAAGDDAYLWLEDLRSEPALDWVRQRNEATLAELSGERFDQMRVEVLEVVDSSDRIPSVKRRGEHLYNFWVDAEHPRGQWRRTTLEEFRKDAPAWDVVVDVDAVAAAEGENWVWAGCDVIEPEYTRALITLSRGGSDAAVVREFDMATRDFVADGFNLPEGRSDVSWVDEDTIMVATDFGEGTMSAAGLPLVTKLWRRGTPLGVAETVFTGSPTDMAAFAGVDRLTQPPRTIYIRLIDNNSRELQLLHDGKPVRIDVPSDAPANPHGQWLIIPLPSGWVRGDTTYAPGTFLVADIDEFLAGTADLHVLHEPDGRKFLIGAQWTKDYLVATSYQDAAARLEVITPGTWERKTLPGVPDNTDTGIDAVDEESNEIFLVASGFDKPPRMLHGYAGGGPVQEIKSAPERFDASDLAVSQHFATSADGTRIPYFHVAHRDSTGPVPTLLGGYGGFGRSMRPNYLGVTGRLWLARGGAYVMPNTRGGMEYGAGWYLQTKRDGRHKVAEDFAAVAGDLIDRGATTASQLGATGASAGGLLMGVMLTQYPELFGALVCRQPLLDMRRFPKLGLGAVFVAEYGDPDDPADWAFIKEYSPYQNISADASYPPILITTSTNDDRVHPGHARKMAAALDSAGHRVLFYENTEGGHTGVSNNAQAAFENALMYEFLHSTLRP